MDILRLFFDCDEFCREFDPYWSARQLSDGKAHRHRDSTLSTSEVMTIVISFQLSGFRNFKTFYTQHVCAHWRGEFPHLVSYQRIVELESLAAVPLMAFLLTRFGRCTGIAFIDSTAIKVCHNLRIKSNKVFRDLAKRGRDQCWLVLRLQTAPGDQRPRRALGRHHHPRQCRRSSAGSAPGAPTLGQALW